MLSWGWAKLNSLSSTKLATHLLQILLGRVKVADCHLQYIQVDIAATSANAQLRSSLRLLAI